MERERNSRGQKVEKSALTYFREEDRLTLLQLLGGGKPFPPCCVILPIGGRLRLDPEPPMLIDLER